VEDLVMSERDIQGRSAGWRPLVKGLRLRGEHVPLRLVQEALSRLKAKERRLARERAIGARISRTVLARDAVWAQDATQLWPGTFAEVIRDVGSCRTLALGVGERAGGADVIALLGAVRKRRGCLPLVWQTDNGPAYTSEAVAKYLKSRRVAHLRSRVHTPTDNACMERAIREIKDEAAAGPQTLAQGLRVLDEGRLRGSKGYVTAAQLDAALPQAPRCVDRARFHAAACAAAAAARSARGGARAARSRERSALWSLLARHALARVEPALTPRRPAARAPQIG
jgi:transposase InsO family protein